MKHGHKPAETRMEDVLASIRRAIDENADGPAQGRLGGSTAEFKVKFDAPANQETRSRRSHEQSSPAGSSPPQGFAGILSGKKSFGELTSPRDAFKPREAVQSQLEPVPPPKNGEGQYIYDGYYGAQVEDYPEPTPEAKPYQGPAPASASPARYLPPPPLIAGQRQSFPQTERLLSESSSEAAQAAFTRLAET